MSYEQRMTHKDNKTSKTFNMVIIVEFSFISAHCITRSELHSAFKMLLRKGDTDKSEIPKELTHTVNHFGAKPVQNASRRVVRKAKYTGSSGNTEGRELKIIENPRLRCSKRIRKEEIMI